MRVVYYFIFYLFGISPIESFSQVELPQGAGFHIERPDEVKLDAKIRLLSKYQYDDLTDMSKWTYDLSLSSWLLYSDKDSSLFYFERAYMNQPYATCRVMTMITNTKRKEGMIRDVSWYLKDLPNFDEEEFIEDCLKILPASQPLVPRDTTEIERTIRNRDQMYRRLDPVPWDKQSPLDSMNRVYIDSLYDARGSLSEFTEGEIDKFSYVCHHSEDCEWVYKWTERFIEYYVSGYEGRSILGVMIQRMFSPDGYCTGQDPQKREYFIYMLRDKYPEFMESLKLGW